MAMPPFARPALTLLFACAGWLPAAWATRIPAVAERLHLSPAAIGVAVLALEGGAIAGLPVGGVLALRAGSRRTLTTGFAVFPAALAFAGLAPSLAVLMAALAVMAFGNSL